jgi:hypothetical protein
MPDKRVAYPRNRLEYIRRLNSRVERLDGDRVKECKEAIWSSYKASSVCTQLATVCSETRNEIHKFKHIGLWSSVKLNKFNARDYYWKPYFSDIGRAIANGERKYLHKVMGHRVIGGKETISRSNPNFSILTERIKYMKRNNLDPDSLLAPIKIFVNFVKFYDSSIDWRNGQLIIEDCILKVFWSHKYAQLNSFLVFNSRAGIWHVIPDVDTGRTVTIALGESSRFPGRVEYLVETLVRYQILDVSAFSRINLSR